MTKRSHSKKRPPREGEIHWSVDTEATAAVDKAHMEGHAEGIRVGIAEGQRNAKADRKEVMAYRQLDVLHNIAQAFVEASHCILQLGQPSTAMPQTTTQFDEKER